jgi:hypothetical protein
MNTTDEKLAIDTLASGAAMERFDDALAVVLANIIDPDTGKGAREINLKVKFKPNDERTMTEIRIECKTKLQPATELTTHAYLGVDIKGLPEAHEIKPLLQSNLPFATTSNVVPIKKEAMND